MFVLKSDRSGYFTGTQAPGTNIYMAGRAIDDRLNTLDIGLPGTIGTPVRMGNLNAKGYALVAKFALSHPLHLLAVCISVVLNDSTDEQRWTDARKLLQFGVE